MKACRKWWRSSRWVSQPSSSSKWSSRGSTTIVCLRKYVYWMLMIFCCSRNSSKWINSNCQQWIAYENQYIAEQKNATEIVNTRFGALDEQLGIVFGKISCITESCDGDESSFSGCNVKVQNGLDATASNNDKDNLVLGYDETEGCSDPKVATQNECVSAKHIPGWLENSRMARTISWSKMSIRMQLSESLLEATWTQFLTILPLSLTKRIQ